jgi:hypothetical protein
MFITCSYVMRKLFGNTNRFYYICDVSKVYDVRVIPVHEIQGVL